MNMRKLLLSTLLVTFLVAPGCGSDGGGSVEGTYVGPTAPAPLSSLGDVPQQVDAGFRVVDDPCWWLYLALENGFSGGEFPSYDKPEAGRPRSSAALIPSILEMVLAADGTSKAEVGSAALVETDEYTINTAFGDPYNSEDGWFSAQGFYRERWDLDAQGWVWDSFDITFTFHDYTFYEYYNVESDLVLSGSVRISGEYRSTADETEPQLSSWTYSMVTEGLRVHALDYDEGDWSFPWFPNMGNAVTYNGAFDAVWSDRYDGVQSSNHTVGGQWIVTGETGEQIRVVGRWAEAWSAAVSEDDGYSSSAEGTLFSTVLGGSVKFSLIEQWGDHDFAFQLDGDGWSFRVETLDDGWKDGVYVDLDGDGQYEEYEGWDVEYAQLLPLFNWDWFRSDLDPYDWFVDFNY